jgi:hypothetical protein
VNIKHALSKILCLDTHSRRNTLRYLSKNNPALWNEMIRLTSFLSANASAPQRTWHIMNDIYEIPKCVETNKNTKWISYDNGYTKTIDRTTKTKHQHKRGDFAHTYDEATNKKRSDSNIRTAKAGLRKTQNITQESIQARTKKTAKTCLERYGVDNYWKTDAMRKLNSELMYERNINNGCTPREKRDERRKYYDEVGYYTEKSWNDHFYKINPGRKLERGPEVHLDHIYSRSEGFNNGISAEIIGHWTNLRLISRLENSSKRHRCDKTLEQLLEDYQNS